MKRDNFPAPREGIVLTHFLTVQDVERSRAFYADVLGMVGKTISHYKVLEKIGQGGVGQVYRATDTKLNRGVAIKVLAEHLSKRGPQLSHRRTSC